MLFKRFLKGINLERKIIPTTIEKTAAKAPFPPLMLPFECNFRLSAPQRNSITHAAAKTMNLDAAIPLRSADTELQNAIQLHTSGLHMYPSGSSKTGSRR